MFHRKPDAPRIVDVGNSIVSRFSLAAHLRDFWRVAEELALDAELAKAGVISVIPVTVNVEFFHTFLLKGVP